MKRNKRYLIAKIAISIACLASFLEAAVTVTDGLVARWTFDGSLLDQTGAHDGATVGAIGYGVGLDGGSLSLAGNGGVFVSNNMSGIQSFTMSIWYRSVYSAQEQLAMQTGMGQIRLSAGQVRCLVFNGRAGRSDLPLEKAYELSITVPTALDGSWHNVVITANGTSAPQGYFDGSLAGVFVYQGTGMSANHNFTTVGYNKYDSVENYQFVGELDEALVYNRALSLGEIQSNFASVPESHVSCCVLLGLSAFLLRRGRVI